MFNQTINNSKNKEKGGLSTPMLISIELMYEQNMGGWLITTF